MATTSDKRSIDIWPETDFFTEVDFDKALEVLWGAGKIPEADFRALNRFRKFRLSRLRQRVPFLGFGFVGPLPEPVFYTFTSAWNDGSQRS